LGFSDWDLGRWLEAEEDFLLLPPLEVLGRLELGVLLELFALALLVLALLLFLAAGREALVFFFAEALPPPDLDLEEEVLFLLLPADCFAMGAPFVDFDGLGCETRSPSGRRLNVNRRRRRRRVVHWP
jgi:hypothetical protein